MKNLILSALMMGAAAISFAGNPKVEGKDATTTRTEEKAGAQLYWYSVQYDASHTNGFVASSTTPVHAEREQMEGECTPGNDKLCQVGYSSPQSLPITDLSTSDDDITKSN